MICSPGQRITNAVPQICAVVESTIPPAQCPLIAGLGGLAQYSMLPICKIRGMSQSTATEPKRTIVILQAELSMPSAGFRVSS
jgi:hypothetical protein